MYPKSPLFTLKEHYGRLLHEANKKPTKIFISSFGVNVGLYNNGRGDFLSNSSLTRDFLNSLEGKKVDILIGFPEQRRGESTRDFKKRKFFLKKATELWPDFNWRVAENNHLKCVGFEKRGSLYCVVTGGRNLTDSSYSDISVVVSKRQREKIKNHFYKFFKKADKI